MEPFADQLGLVGTTIADKYAVESVVGQGGFAVVYRAIHNVWKRPVAVKVFNALGDVAPEQRKKLLDDFIQEGALLADLSERSAAICQARDIGTLTTPGGHDVPYMVLEWLEGKPLDAILEEERARNAPLRSLDAAVRLLDPIAEALALAHKKGIAHRDLKPANVFVLLDASGEVAGMKLLDFGIAKVVQDAQKMGFTKTAGHVTSFTPLYGAPEQFTRTYGATGPWTDVFALALVTAEIVSGREAMVGDSLVQLACAAADDRTRPTPRTLGVAVSDEVEAIFQRAVAVSPSARWPTAGDFWNALRVAVIGDPMAAASSPRSSGGGPAALATSDTIVDTGPHGPAPAAATALPPSNPSLAQIAPAPRATSRAPIVVAAALAVVAIGGGVAFALRRGSTPAPLPSTPPPPVVASSAPPAPACPPGMIAIPGGEFFMGSDEKDAFDFEKPAHKVKLSPYCLDELEVTVAQYKECSDRGACRRAGKENDWPDIKPAQRKIYDALCNINDAEAKATHPVNCVDWAQAREACEARGARLPTEAEWELAARGTDGRFYPWGDDPPSARLLNACGKECVAWQKKHPDPDHPPAFMYDADDGFANTAPVGSFPEGKSRYGIQDMVGNVWEWVADYYADYEKAAATAVDPKGPASGADRVIRGGAWNGAMPAWVRPSFRFHVAPTARSYGYGFRCAKSL
ncbi:MAG: SUMF1/EgtB/PvdO family nonheme iron enzyme [Labilithrix sp.]|nr:SUMF1/EgtB/PvdO family nonheme iron enzyme [Labilithrix sp.]